MTAGIKRHAISLSILTVSLTVSIVEWNVARNAERHEAQLEFTRIAQSYQHQLERRMAVDFRFLADLSGLIATSDKITYQQFMRYIDGVNNLMSIQSIQYLGYLQIGRIGDVTGASGALLETVALDDRSAVTGPSSKTFSLVYNYPDGGSAGQKSLDLAAFKEPDALEAMRNAGDWGTVVATGRLDNAFNINNHPSFLLFAPVYREPPSPHTVTQRRAALKGFVYEAFRTNKLLWAAWGKHFEDGLDVRLAVADTPGRFSTIYDSITPDSRGDNFLYEGRFYDAGREWLLSIRSPARAYMSSASDSPMAILLAGISISLLLTAVSALWDERRHMARIQQEQNQRFRSLFDQNPDAVYSLDLNGNFTAANRQTEILAGKPIEQLLTICPSSLVAPDKRDETLQRFELALQGHPTYGETAIVQPNGGRVELGETNLPIVIDGKMVGIFGVAKDITARKRTEAALQKARDELEEKVQARTVALRQEVEARKKTEAALRDLAEHLQSVREDERTRIAREIHDELGGALAAIKFALSALTQQGLQDCDQVMQRSLGSIPLVDNAIAALRRIIADLRPSILDDLGLWATLEWLAHEFETRMGIRVLFDLEGEEMAVSPDQATAIFRIVQEALNNVAKHAQATLVEILATTTAHTISIMIQDNGKGFSPDTNINAKTYGILGMHERAQSFNGTVEITSQPGAGTTVLIEFPV